MTAISGWYVRVAVKLCKTLFNWSVAAAYARNALTTNVLIALLSLGAVIAAASWI